MLYYEVTKLSSNAGAIILVPLYLMVNAFVHVCLSMQQYEMKCK